MGNEYCCYSFKKPLGSSIFLVQKSKNSLEDSAISSGKECKYASNTSIQEFNNEYTKNANPSLKTIDKDSIESTNSNPFFKIGIINSGIRFPDN